MRCALVFALVLAGCESTPILLYHSIGESFDPPRHVSTENFRAQIDYLLQQGYTILDARELDAVEAGKRPRPARPIVLTFDDGYENFYLHAFPILKARNVAATMFVITGRTAATEAARVVHPTRHLIWPEILELEASGIDIESHSVTHPRLKQAPRDFVFEEAVKSKADLEAHLGRPVTIFAYPNGAEDKNARQTIEAAGYESAVSVSTGLDTNFDRQRISIHTGDDLRAFAAKIGGTWWGKTGGERP